MANTGYKIYNNLIEVYVDNLKPTGNTKPNTLGDPDYLPPVLDEDKCNSAFTLKIVTGAHLEGSEVYIESASNNYTLERDGSSEGENSISIEDNYYLVKVTVPVNRAKTITIGSDVRTNYGPYNGGDWIEYFNNISGDITVNVTTQDIIYSGDNTSGGYFCEQDGTTTTTSSSSTTTSTTQSPQQRITINNEFEELTANKVDFTVKQDDTELVSFKNESYGTPSQHVFNLYNFTDTLSVDIKNNYDGVIIIQNTSTNELYNLDYNESITLYDFPNDSPILLRILSEDQGITYNYYWGCQSDNYVINEFSTTPFSKEGNQVTVWYTNKGGDYMYFISLSTLGEVTSIIDNFGSEVISDWSFIEEIVIDGLTYRLMRMNYITGIYEESPRTFIF